MNLVSSSIRFPVTVAVGVLIAVFGGLLALTRVPVQLTPDIDRPVVTVNTTWFGASPEEIEKEIVEEQEEYLKSVEGVTQMSSESHDGYGLIRLEFNAGTDLTAATVRVTNKLNEVPSYPLNADRPVVSTTSPFDRAVAWFVILAEEPGSLDPARQVTFVEDMVIPRLERVEGVAGVAIFGGLERELHVTFDPDLLASMGISTGEIATALRSQSQDISAGDFGEGKRRYVVRTMARYQDPESVAETVIAVRAGVPIRVADVAEVALAYKKPAALVRFQGVSSLAFAVQRQLGANVLEVTEKLLAETEQLNEEILAPRGLVLKNVYRETHYIEASIDRVFQSLYLGGFLAVVVLLLFLRSPTSTLIVALAIPISVIAAFFSMYLLGRTINVISLAGMAFAVGMVVDNAIVVLENIYRHLQMGKSRRRAAADGALEVWGAILASTITTVAVFLPIVFIQERAGQLFRDLAIAISTAIVISLVVAVSVIPSASAKILRTQRPDGEGARRRFIAALAERIARLVDALNASDRRRLTAIVAVVAVAVGLSWWLLPSAEYLPNGNQNFVFGVLLPPPGYNLEEMERIGVGIEAQLADLWETPEQEASELPGGGVQSFWYVGLFEMAFIGVEARQPERVAELLPITNQALFSVPGAMGFASQWSLFSDSDSFAGTRSVRIDVTGPVLENVLGIAGEVFQRVGEILPGASSRPIPGLDLGNPEVRVYPDRVRAADVGLDAATIGQAVNSLIDGMKVAEYFHEGRELDLVLKGSDEWARHTQSVADLPLAVEGGRVIRVGDVAEVHERQGPVQINRVERQRAVSIEVLLPSDVPLEEAVTRIEEEIVLPLREAGRLGRLYDIRLRGAADDLSRLRQALGMNFVVVLALTFLLLAALFQSFLYPLVIMFTVPLATLGGVLGLRLVRLFDPQQQLDILTMLGFVILVGTVINNAILIVYYALQRMREGVEARAAVAESVRVRVRPILMSTTTSALGMAPLVVMPGAGSELYRGLGSVVVGGLLLSTAITLVLTPLVFSVAIELSDAVRRRLGLAPALTEEPA